MKAADTSASRWRAHLRRRATAGLSLATVAPALAAVTLGIGVATAPAAQAAPVGCTITDLVTTCTFTYTGAPQAWVVPTGVDEVTFSVVGAAGGNAGGRPGGRGGGLNVTVAVTPGTAYQLFVGGKGGNETDPLNPGVGGWNGGANGAGIFNPGGGGGGGASDIRTAPYDIDSRVLVAGGGGGAGSAITYDNAPHGIPGAGGDGGGIRDGHQGGNVSGSWVGAGGGGGATTYGPGLRGGPSNPIDYLYNGCGFWDAAYPTPGEVGGLGHSDNRGRGGAGGSLVSLSGRRCDQFRGWGGGGGGGWYGGGGGGGGITAGAGGGGGSGHAPAGAKASFGQPGAQGVITIAYSAWQTVPGGGVMTSAPTVAPRPTTAGQPDQHDVFYLDAHSQVIQRLVTNGVASPEYNLGAVLYPGSTVAAAWRPDGKRLDLFGRGTENALWQKTFTWAGGWDAWHPVAGADAMDSEPTAVSVAPDRVDVFYRSTDDHDSRGLQRVEIRDGRSPSVSAVPNVRSLGTAPAAFIAPDGYIRVCYGGDSSEPVRVVCKELHPSSGWWNAAMPNGGWMLPRSAPAVVRVGDHAVVAVRVSSTQVAWIRVQDDNAPQTWQVRSAPSPADSAPALVTRPNGSYLYLRGTDNQLIARDIDVI